MEGKRTHLLVLGLRGLVVLHQRLDAHAHLAKIQHGVLAEELVRTRVEHQLALLLGHLTGCVSVCVCVSEREREGGGEMSWSLLGSPNTQRLATLMHLKHLPPWAGELDGDGVVVNLTQTRTHTDMFTAF